MRWEAGGMSDEESPVGSGVGKTFIFYSTRKENQAPQQLCRSGKLTGDNGENRDEFQKNSVFSVSSCEKETSDFPRLLDQGPIYRFAASLIERPQLNASDDYNRTIDDKIATIKKTSGV